MTCLLGQAPSPPKHHNGVKSAGYEGKIADFLLFMKFVSIIYAYELKMTQYLVRNLVIS